MSGPGTVPSFLLNLNTLTGLMPVVVRLVMAWFRVRVTAILVESSTDTRGVLNIRVFVLVTTFTLAVCTIIRKRKEKKEKLDVEAGTLVERWRGAFFENEESRRLVVRIFFFGLDVLREPRF
jgi:hypothetical protein